jgi:hypothetical protein
MQALAAYQAHVAVGNGRVGREGAVEREGMGRGAVVREGV